MTKKDPLNTSREPILQDDSHRVYDKEQESYDTVLDEIVGRTEVEEDVEAEYEGIPTEELDDEPPY